MKPTIEQIKEVRLRTGLGVVEVAAAFKAVNSSDKVYEYLEQRGVVIAGQKQKRNAGVSRLYSYVHNGKLGAMVEFRCETDFVAKSDEFKAFMQDICLHVAANPLPYAQPNEFRGFDYAFLNQPFVKDITKTVADVVAEISAKTGEKVEVGMIQRLVAA